MASKTFAFGACAVAAVVVTTVSARRADACGACFAPTGSVTEVRAHRMVVSLSPQRSILWDQLTYTGDPKDFVWVLPVPTPSVTIQLADPAFFDEIDQLTTPQVRPEPLPFSGSGVGCGASAELAGDDDDDDGEQDVVIYDEAVVGPYETVTIGSEDGGALQDWLVQNGYRVTEAQVPTIMHYVERGDVFVVLRLAPGENVTSMQPVRVEYPGYMATFPLKMVTIGASGVLELKLWVISEQRYEAYNYANAVVDPSVITFDWETRTTNYAEVFNATIDANGGRAWVTEYARSINSLYFPEGGQELAPVREDIPVPFVTRMRTATLTDHLTDDLILVPAADASEISDIITAGIELNRPDSGSDGDGGCRASGVRSSGGLLLVTLVGAIGLRRRRRSRHR